MRLRWTDPAAPTRLGLVAVGPDDNEARWLFPRESGKPFRLQTTWGMNDVGHATYTAWTFGYYILEDDPYFASQNFAYPRPREAWNVDVEIVVRRSGALPIEDGHPDLWDGRSSLEVARSTVVVRSGVANNVPVANLTPPGTTRVEVVVHRTPTLLDAPWVWDVLYYKTAAHPNDCADGFGGLDEDFQPRSPTECMRKAEPPTSKDATLTWTIPVRANETDPEYARKPNWMFWLDSRDHETGRARDLTLFCFFGESPLYCQEITLTVTVHRG